MERVMEKLSGGLLRNERGMAIVIAELSEDARKVLLYGSKDEHITFVYESSKGNKMHRSHPFEGIIPNMERRYRETESTAVREELGKYQGVQRCQECGGTRLNRAARSVFVDKMNLPDVSSMSVANALDRLTGLELAGWRGELRPQVHLVWIVWVLERCPQLDTQLEFLVPLHLDGR